jgi:PAS domain S-box-containing protein
VSKNLILIFLLGQFVMLAGLMLTGWQWTSFHGFFAALLVVLGVAVLLVKHNEDKTLQRRLDLLLSNSEKVKSHHIIPKIEGEDQIAKVNSRLGQIGIEIAESERKEKSVADRAVDVICSIGLDQTFLSTNAAVEKAWGYSPNEIVGKKFTEFLVDDDRESSLQTIIGAEQSVDTLSFENRIKHKNGAVINTLWSAHWSAADKALFCVAHDITERKKLEKILEESEARFRQIFARMPVGLILANPLGIIEMSNPTIEGLSGYTAEQLIGKNLQQVLIKQSAQEIEKSLGKLVDISLKSQDGRDFNCQVSSSEISVLGNRKFLLAIVDTTERERLEQLKQAFFAMVSHDLRSPLSSLLSMLDMLHAGKLGELSDSGKGVVERNSREVSRLINLVNELLDIEKMRSGEFEINEDRFLVDEAIDSAINAVHGLAARKEIPLVFERTRISVVADQALLIRVLVNLLSNAIKFSPEKSAVQIHCTETDAGIRFSVSDKGRGVRAEHKQKIFELFQQAESQDSNLRGGTGLGLTICKMIVEQHGGRIWVDSQQGSGSTFSFLIPKKKLSFESLD